MQIHGDPIRIAFSGALASTSQALGLYVPGTNNAYTLAPTDIVYLTSITGWTSASTLFILSAPAGASTQTQSTLLVAFSGGGYSSDWHDEVSEACAGPQGVVPSLLGYGSTGNAYVTGTGFVVHAPGFVQSWRAPNS